MKGTTGTCYQASITILEHSNPLQASYHYQAHSLSLETQQCGCESVTCHKRHKGWQEGGEVLLFFLLNLQKFLGGALALLCSPPLLLHSSGVWVCPGVSSRQHIWMEKEYCSFAVSLSGVYGHPLPGWVSCQSVASGIVLHRASSTSAPHTYTYTGLSNYFCGELHLTIIDTANKC